MRKNAWAAFTRALGKSMTPEEASLLSIQTVKKLAHHYKLDQDTMFVASLELEWREIAQKREDQRNKKAVMHKQCAKADNVAAARQIAKSMDASSDKRR